MLIVNDILVNEDIVEEQFVCNLNACKGACCWEGDYGAPLALEELQVLESIRGKLRPFLTAEGMKVLESQGAYKYNQEIKGYETPLLDNQACAYMYKDVSGIAKCGIEAAYQAGEVKFKKPVSCHLYPIRVEVDQQNGFQRLNYDRWDICSAACDLGKKSKIPVYVFVKEAIIRQFGEEFYVELDAMASYLKSNEGD